MQQPQLPTGYGVGIDERVVEYPWLFSQLPSGPGLLLDAGSALNHGYLLHRSPLADKRVVIVTLAPEKFSHWRMGIGYLFDDLRGSILGDERFDCVASISTIEHIGLDNTLLYTTDGRLKEADSDGYVLAVREFRRVLRKGGVCFISVPFGRAVVRGWFQVFDLRMIERIVTEFGPAAHSIDYFGYSATGWQRCDPLSLADATVFDVHSEHAPAPDLAASSRGVACIKLVR
jgi:hypothetical protein